MSEAANRKQVSSEGMKKLEEKLAYLTGPRRAEVAEKLNIARGYGDLSENAEYDAAKNEQALLEAEIMELEATIRNVEVVDNIVTSNDAVSLGSRVQIHFEEDNEDDTYVIVGALESDPLHNRISNESPLGAALLGKAKGDTAAVEPPSGEIYHVTVLDISRDD
ncbi:MAG: transcription elongation factor GreA [Clostridia bacterium]|nr:transcription elongation factor GreA [Clostridia bacterium]